MNNVTFNDELDIMLFNYFNNSEGKNTFEKYIEKRELNFETLKQRFLWLKQMNINPNIIHLQENHKLIYDIFDKCNFMLNENNIEYYYTSGILAYLLVDKELQRYHHDLDIFVNMQDLSKLENISSNYGFSFERVLGLRNDGNNRVMLKLYYKDFKQIPITIFMYVRNQDNSIEQNDYFISEKGLFVEKMYNSPVISNLSFSDEPKIHNGVEYYSITLEALYLSKKGNRPKDIYDCEQIKNYLNKNNMQILEEEFIKNYRSYILEASDDDYFEFIFSDFCEKGKVLKK